MAAAPQVQSLADIISSLAPAYNQQESIAQQQAAAIPAQYDAQRAALTAAKGQGFNDINNQATSRGLSFSGIPLDEQATYLSTQYLPGIQAANAQQNKDQLTAEGQLADIEQNKQTQALGIQQNQTSALNSWNLQQESEAAQEKLQQEQNAFTAAQNAQDRAAQQAAQGPSTADAIAALNNWAATKVGGDGKLSPNSFKAGYQQAALYGIDPDTYSALMQQYVNQSHAKDYVL